jgi:hypothetical protein
LLIGDGPGKRQAFGPLANACDPNNMNSDAKMIERNFIQRLPAFAA